MQEGRKTQLTQNFFDAATDFQLVLNALSKKLSILTPRITILKMRKFEKVLLIMI